MNKIQEKVIQQIKEKAWSRHARPNPEDYEFKEFKIDELTIRKFKIISLILEIGLKNDQNTLASVFARDKHHFFIGPRGGIWALNRKNHRVYGRKAWIVKPY